MRKIRTVKLGTPESSQDSNPPQKRIRLSAPPRPPLAVNDSQKGKQKATYVEPESDSIDERLWVDQYEPATEAELAVHVRKVEDVRRWFREAFDTRTSKFRVRLFSRILALTGPAGSAKTTTVHVLARELGLEILEWRNATDDSARRNVDDSDSFVERIEYESPIEKFKQFLERASSNTQNIFAFGVSSRKPNPASVHDNKPNRRRIILLEDLPNILHPATQNAFHDILKAFVQTPAATVPIVIIVSDAGLRGELAAEERGGMWSSKTEVVDIRSVLPKELLGGLYATQIQFNPIAPTLLRKALLALLQSHFSISSSSAAKRDRRTKASANRDTIVGMPTAELLDRVVESANGDIRSAIMSLQFACVVERPSKRGNRKEKGRANANGKGENAVVVGIEGLSRREQALGLFHMLGKVFYNKRKGDSSGTNCSKAERKREKELDARLVEPPELPSFLEEHERRASRVDLNALHDGSPIDASLLSLYLHQNYIAFCDTIDQAERISDVLSFVDASMGVGDGGIHTVGDVGRFAVLVRGVMHALPSPVLSSDSVSGPGFGGRGRGAVGKPYFFEAGRRELEARDGVEQVREWLLAGDRDGDGEGGEGKGRASSWSRKEIAMELGAVLRARDASRGNSSGLTGALPPDAHVNFSRLVFVRGDGTFTGGSKEGGDLELEDLEDEVDGDGLVNRNRNRGEGDVGGEDKAKGGWLDEDDIDELSD